MDDTKITEVNFKSESDFIYYSDYYTKYLEQHGINKRLEDENTRLKKRIEELEKENTAMDSELYDLESFIRVMTSEEVKTVTERMINDMRQRYTAFWAKHRKDDEQNG